MTKKRKRATDAALARVKRAHEEAVEGRNTKRKRAAEATVTRVTRAKEEVGMRDVGRIWEGTSDDVGVSTRSRRLRAAGSEQWW